MTEDFFEFDGQESREEAEIRWVKLGDYNGHSFHCSCKPWKVLEDQLGALKILEFFLASPPEVE